EKPGFVKVDQKKFIEEIIRQNPDSKNHLLYGQIRGDHFEMIRTLVRCGQRERSMLVIDEKLKYTREENISKDAVPELLLQIAKSCLYLGEIDKARLVFAEFMGRKDECYRDKLKLYVDLLNYSALFEEYGNTVTAEQSLKEAKAFIVEFFKEGNKWNSSKYYGEREPIELTDYDAAFEIAEILDENSKENKKYKWNMAQQLFNSGQREKAYRMGYSLEGTSENEIYILRDQSALAEKLIKEDKLEEALKITETMEGDNRRGYISGVKQNAAYEYARLGNLDKALSLIENTGDWSPASSMRYVGKVLMHYVDGNNPSPTEQKAIINKLLIDLKMLDYETSLSGSDNYGLRDKSLVNLAMEAENDVLKCATYIAKKGWGNIINKATHLTLYAQGLLDLQMHDEIPQVIEDAVEILQADSDKRAYIDLYLDLADIWIKLGENEKAIDLIDIYKEANKIPPDYGSRFDDILAIPLAYRKAGSIEKAEDFFIELDSGKFFFEEDEYDNNSILLKASWLAEIGKYDEAWKLLSDELPEMQGWSRLYTIPETAIKNGDYAIALKYIHQSEEKRNTAYLLSKLVDSMKADNLDVDFLELFEPVLEEIQSSKDDKYKVSTISYTAKLYFNNGYAEKAKMLLDQALQITRKLPDEKYGASPEQMIANSYLEFGFYDDAVKIYAKSKHPFDYSKIIELRKANDYAESGEFDKALKIYLKQDCLANPSETFTVISKLMIEAGKYDRAFETLDLISDPTRVKRCPEHGMIASMGNPYDIFPELFLDANRIDLALKILKYLHDEDLIHPLMKIEAAIRKTGYQLTEDDKTSLRSLIHSDKRYVLYPVEQ
ncbi:MAG: hypothetical protein ABIG42_09155, partial [bacterium]